MKPILKNKIFLYMTEFFAGMSVMAVELGASRLLAPYFSSSQIVWTIIIGTIMIAMALGNIYGGRSADKNPDPDRLYKRILIAAVWIGAIPAVGKYIILGLSGVLIFAVNTNILVVAAFAACMVIFVFPLFLLGTVTPSLAKYSVDSLEESGKTVGNLGAFNTIGSIIGTFVPTFVTIPAVGTSVTFLIFSGILLVLSAIYFLSGGGSVDDKKSSDCKGKSNPASAKSRSAIIRLIIALVLFILCCIFGNSDSFAFWEKDLVYEGESVYNYLQVKEDSERVYLSTNVLFGVQSLKMKEPGLTGMYYDYAMLAPLMAGVKEKENFKILILGMGTGTFGSQCRNYYGNVDITGVEIDEKIIGLAGKYFDMPKDIPVAAYDGRAYLNAVDEKYDVIMVDAYQDITIPFQMSSVEFFTLVREHLNEGGVMVVNMNMKGNSEGNINQYLSDTISRVFPNVRTIDVMGSTNRELFASVGDVDAVLKRNQGLLEGGELLEFTEMIEGNLLEYEAGDYLLTDDCAPVELLGMKVIDELIQEEVRYYKYIYEKEGIKGLLRSLG